MEAVQLRDGAMTDFTDDEYLRLSHRHGAAWDHLPLTEQPSNLRNAWPVWAWIAVVVLVAAWVLA
jgi:hypothetical protein